MLIRATVNQCFLKRRFSMSGSRLLSPCTINGMTLRNRIILPSMVTYHAAVNGEVTEKMIRYHEERAKGGVGLNILEATYVEQGGNSYDIGVGISSDAMIRGLSQLTAAVHRHGGKMAVQLKHGGRTANPPTSHHPRRLVSMIPGLTPSEGSRVMDVEEIQYLVDCWAQAARRAVTAGFDAVEVHGAHGYLINQFMSPLTNQRNDAYGGSFEKRMRFPVEVVKAVRAVVGASFPILFRFSVEEFMPDGLTLGDSERIAKVMVDSGVDALHVTIGIGETVEYIIPPASVPDGWNADRAAAIKQAINGKVPVAVAGRIYNREIAEGIINSGKADLVSMGRALLADPHLPNKLAEGRDDEIIYCIGCNEGCTGMLNKCKPVSCALNPRTGYEADYPVRVVARPLNVVVVGGGPAGCEAARTAAENGHHVVLFEKADRLGGLANVAALPPGKNVFASIGHYYATVLPKMGVDLRMSTAADAAMIGKIAPDHLFVAVGAVPIVPEFCVKATNTVLARDVLEGSVATGPRVLVLGGGLVGAETAEFLAEQGKDVTIAEQRDALAIEMEYKTRQMVLKRLGELGVRALLNTQVTELCADGTVTVKNSYGVEKSLPRFDKVVVALGYRQNTSLCRELATLDLPFTPLGDCRCVGKIIDGVWEAFHAAYAL